MLPIVFDGFVFLVLVQGGFFFDIYILFLYHPTFQLVSNHHQDG